MLHTHANYLMKTFEIFILSSCYVYDHKHIQQQHFLFIQRKYFVYFRFSSANFTMCVINWHLIERICVFNLFFSYFQPHCCSYLQINGFVDFSYTNSMDRFQLFALASFYTILSLIQYILCPARNNRKSIVISIQNRTHGNLLFPRNFFWICSFLFSKTNSISGYSIAYTIFYWRQSIKLIHVEFSIAGSHSQKRTETIWISRVIGVSWMN